MERFETKYDLMNRVYKDNRLKRTTKAVMQYLVALSGKEKCNPAVSTIAQAIGMSERTVQRHMRLLEQYGYLERKSRYYRHEQITNEYVFILSVVNENEAKVVPIGIKETESDISEAGKAAEGIPAHPLRKKDYLKWIYRDNQKLLPAEKVLLTYLVHKANVHSRTYGRINAICHDIRISRRQFKKLLCSIRRKGIVQVKINQNTITVQLQPIGEQAAPEEVKEMIPDKKQDAVIQNNSDYENHICENILKGKFFKRVPFIRKIIQGIRLALYHFLS